MSFDTISTLNILHLELDGFFPVFMENYKLNQGLELSSKSFKLALKYMPHFISKWSFWDVLLTPSNFFLPKDSRYGFLKLLQLCFHITQGHISHQIACP
jgi:hypothetical protein